jgi:hypothetical protein
LIDVIVFFLHSIHLLHHYLSRFDSETNLLHPSQADFTAPDAKRPTRLGEIVLRVFARLGLTKLEVHATTGEILKANNLTILNFFLLRLGPMGEKRLVQVLMCSQVSYSIELILHTPFPFFFPLGSSLLLSFPPFPFGIVDPFYFLAERRS